MYNYYLLNIYIYYILLLLPVGNKSIPTVQWSFPYYPIPYDNVIILIIILL